MKILTGSDATITSPTFVAADGYTGTDTDSTPTVTATSAAGQTVTLGSVTNPSSPAGVYTVTVQGLTNPDLLTLTWTGAVSSVDQRYVQQVDVVGGVYASLAEIRAMEGVNHPTKHSTARILELRDEFEELAERFTGKAWVPRFAQETLRDAELTHTFPRSLLSVVDADSVAITFTDWLLTEDGDITDHYGHPIRVYGTWPFTVKYLHGADLPPVGLVDACKSFVRSKLLADGNRVARDTLRQTDPAGITEQFSTPDWNAGRPTGLLDVDRALRSFALPAIG